jgi:hypothetical protein
MRIHLRAPAYLAPRPLCGTDPRFAGQLTRDEQGVTCRVCIQRLAMARAGELERVVGA